MFVPPTGKMVDDFVDLSRIAWQPKSLEKLTQSQVQSEASKVKGLHKSCQHFRSLPVTNILGNFGLVEAGILAKPLGNILKQ
jgi:hypothetical protein